MDEIYVTYVDDEHVDNHDYDDTLMIIMIVTMISMPVHVMHGSTLVFTCVHYPLLIFHIDRSHKPPFTADEKLSHSGAFSDHLMWTDVACHSVNGMRYARDQ